MKPFPVLAVLAIVSFLLFGITSCASLSYKREHCLLESSYGVGTVTDVTSGKVYQTKHNTISFNHSIEFRDLETGQLITLTQYQTTNCDNR